MSLQHADYQDILKALADSPRWFLREIRPGTPPCAVFFSMTRSDYTNSSFLDHRAVCEPDSERAVPLGALLAFLQQHPMPNSRSCFIFHTALCGSTLLARCLDVPGHSFSYKEPFLLHQMCMIQRQRRLGPPALQKQYSTLLSLAGPMLSRVWHADEIAIIKPSDSCTNLCADALAWHEDNRALLLYSDLDSFLVSMLKSPSRRQFVRGLVPRAVHDLRSVNMLPLTDGNAIKALNDAESAALVWLGQIRLYQRLLAQHPQHTRSLNAADFFADPHTTLCALDEFFELGLNEQGVRDIVASDILGRDSKVQSQGFSATDAKTKRLQMREQLQNEINQSRAFIQQAMGSDPVPDNLDSPLITTS